MVSGAIHLMIGALGVDGDDGAILILPMTPVDGPAGVDGAAGAETGGGTDGGDTGTVLTGGMGRPDVG